LIFSEAVHYMKISLLQLLSYGTSVLNSELFLLFKNLKYKVFSKATQSVKY